MNNDFKEKCKSYTAEFKTEALKLAQIKGVVSVAKELGLCVSQLYNWRRPHQHNDGMSPAHVGTRPNQVSGFS
ncbi:transposase [Aeromonas veronii]|uniref:transposase n=1 Tax=Aeromonas veronii TaxID=654 RepID=UPI003D19FDAE